MNQTHAYKLIASDPDAVAILSKLLNNPDNFTSGSELSSILGVSRPAVWGKLEKLRDQGFKIDALRNRGYRILENPLQHNAQLLEYETLAKGCAIPCLYFPEIDSTNSEAERQISYGRKGPFAIISSQQSKGRGRLGRDWFSASTENSYLSVAFEPNVPAKDLQAFTLWAGIYICRALQKLIPQAKLQIKWPNDLFCQGRKFAGMLTEAKIDADCMRSLIFGIGININSNPQNYPDPLKKTATSLQALSGTEYSLNTITAELIHAIEHAYQHSILGKPGESLAKAWSPLSSLCGQSVSATSAQSSIRGTACGIEESGALLIKDATGSVHPIHAGDVQLSK
jgi:BirA family biotin operon repressor/biotin-[acetyl-CoA-carboxylase] ligase